MEAQNEAEVQPGKVGAGGRLCGTCVLYSKPAATLGLGGKRRALHCSNAMEEHVCFIPRPRQP